jgi:hypothetical protein
MSDIGSPRKHLLKKEGSAAKINVSPVVPKKKVAPKDEKESDGKDKQSLKKKMQALMENQKRMEQRKDKLKRTDDNGSVILTPNSPGDLNVKPTQVSSPLISSPLSISSPISTASPVISPATERKRSEKDIFPVDSNVSNLARQLDEAIQRHKLAEQEIAQLKSEHEEKMIDIQLSLVS